MGVYTHVCLSVCLCACACVFIRTSSAGTELAAAMTPPAHPARSPAAAMPYQSKTQTPSTPFTLLSTDAPSQSPIPENAGSSNANQPATPHSSSRLQQSAATSTTSATRQGSFSARTPSSATVGAASDANRDYVNGNDQRHKCGIGMLVEENDDGFVHVLQINPGSPAWECGKIAVGDIIYHVDSHPVRTTDDIFELVVGYEGSTLVLDVESKMTGVRQNIRLIRRAPSATETETAARGRGEVGVERGAGGRQSPAARSSTTATSNSHWSALKKEVHTGQYRSPAQTKGVRSPRFNGNGPMQPKASISGSSQSRGSLSGVGSFRETQQLSTEGSFRSSVLPLGR